MRTTLFRLLPAAALALPLLALAAFAQDKPSSPCRAAGASAAPPAIQQTPYTQLEGPPPAYLNQHSGIGLANEPHTPPPQRVPQPGDNYFEGPPPFVNDMPPQPVVSAPPTLEEMVKELKELREREKQLSAAIREKVKAQRKALDDAEREVGGAPADGFTWMIFR
jgi:hypothetical protein